jgi:hypothetical protein
MPSRSFFYFQTLQGLPKGSPFFILPKLNKMKTKQHYTEQLENIGYTVDDLTTANDICGVLLVTPDTRVNDPGIGYMLYLPNSKYNSPSEEKFNKIGVCVVDADTLEPLDGEGIYLEYYTEINEFHKRVLNR